MKTLVYGVDGLSLDLLKGVCPEFHLYLMSLKHIPVEEDTLGRGWSKIITGAGPNITNAFFQMPASDGTYAIDRSYSMESDGAHGNPHYKYLWEIANELDIRSIFMNIPTTSPAPRVSTVFVSGIGGGRSWQDGMDDEFFYPPEIKKTMNLSYELDVRLTGIFGDLPGFVEKLNQVHRSQINTFADLAEDHECEFGFYANKLSAELQFLALYDIENIDSADKGVSDSLRLHYKSIFDDFTRVVERLSPENIVIVSDHGTTSYKYNVNIDVLLEKLGYFQSKKNIKRFLPQKFIKSIKSALPHKYKKQIKTALKVNNKRFPIRTPDKRLCKAFSSIYDTGNFCGVFLNDDRFGGAVTRIERELLREKIIQDLNASPEFLATGFNAVKYQNYDSTKEFEYKYPDIQIVKADEYFVAKDKWQFLTVNENFGSIGVDIKHYKYPLTGVKSRNALIATNVEQALPEGEDLRAAYNLITEIMKNQK